MGKLRLSKIDQDNLTIKVELWKQQYPGDHIFFRGHALSTDKDPMVKNFDFHFFMFN